MALLKLIIEPDPMLHKLSEPVKMVDSELQRFMDDMLETMYEELGGGLAAVQVGVLKRVLIFDPSSYLRQKHDPFFMVNPEITYFSEQKCVMDEGCLSVPFARFDILRSESIKVQYLDYYGKEQELHAKGIVARGIQHEIDHLNGITLLHYVTKMRKEITLKKLKKYKKYHTQ